METIINAYDQISKTLYLRFIDAVSARTFLLIKKLSLLLLFFMPLTGVFWPAYVYIAIHSVFHLSLQDLKKERWLVGLFALFLFVKTIQLPAFNNFLFLKNFAGMYLFYYYFRYINKTNITKWLISSTVLCIGLNFILNASSNYSITMFHSIDKLNKYLFHSAYVRPIALGQNATIMSVVILSYLMANPKEAYNILKKKYLYLTTVVIGSGVGLVGLIFHSFMKMKKSSKHLLILGCFITAYFGLYYFSGIYIYTGNIFYKISPDYISRLLNDKYIVTSNTLFQMSPLELFIGKSLIEIAPTGADFGWLSVITTGGILGIFITIFLFSKLFKYNKEILFLLILSSFHYQTTWWSMGQIFLGYLAARLFIEKENPDTPRDQQNSLRVSPRKAALSS